MISTTTHMPTCVGQRVSITRPSTRLKEASKQLKPLNNLPQVAIAICYPAHRHPSPHTRTHTREGRRASTTASSSLWSHGVQSPFPLLLLICFLGLTSCEPWGCLCFSFVLLFSLWTSKTFLDLIYYTLHYCT